MYTALQCRKSQKDSGSAGEQLDKSMSELSSETPSEPAPNELELS
jgi:hypothetical protein